MNRSARGLAMVWVILAAAFVQGAAAQTVDSFDPNANMTVTCLAVQADGNILLGGAFTAVGWVPRNYLARVSADGALDTTFDPSPNDIVNGIAVQPDGKILVVGKFTAIGGATRNHIARLLADGTLDAAFDPNCNGEVLSLGLRADGKLLVGGYFSNVGGATRHMLARLNADGTADATFADPNLGNSVFSLAEQEDGKVVAGGVFTPVVGVNRYYLARFNADGSLDASFDPSPNDQVYSVAIQKDGKILLGGRFSWVGDTARRMAARLEPDGALDTTFAPEPDGYVYTIAFSTDGMIYLGGSFAHIGTVLQGRVARLFPDGTLDATFHPSPAHYVQGVTLQADGKVLLGGNFQSVDSSLRNHVARLTNSAPLQTLDIAPDGTFVHWVRGQSSPEVFGVTFEDSADGILWNRLADPARVSDGWLLSGIALPANETRFLRATGIERGGNHGASLSAMRAQGSYNIFGYDLTVTKSGTGVGRVASAPAGIDCGSDCAQAYASKTAVTLTATPAMGSGFTGWGGSCLSCGTNPACVVTLNGDRSCSATFSVLPKAGEASGPGFPMTAEAGAGTAVALDFTPAPCATGHSVYWGEAAGSLSALEWTGPACGLGANSPGTFDPGEPPAGHFLYFVVVGNNGWVEGSYGEDSAGNPRPDADDATDCHPQDTTMACSAS